MSNTLRERAQALLRSQQPGQYPDVSQYTPPRYGDMVDGRIYGDTSVNPHPVDARMGARVFFKSMAHPVTVYHDSTHPIHQIAPAIAQDNIIKQESPFMTQLNYLRAILMMFAADLKDNAKSFALVLCVCLISVWQVTSANAANTVLQDQNRARATVIAELTQANTLLSQQYAAEKKQREEYAEATDKRIRALESQVAAVAVVGEGLQKLAEQTAVQTALLKQTVQSVQRTAQRSAAQSTTPAPLLALPPTGAGPSSTQ